MKDDRSIMKAFCKIVQRFPDLYDHNSDTYRRWCAESAWEKVAECVRNELNEPCTIEELRLKWKGIRSSYNRYKNRLSKSKLGSKPFKDYYLHSTLTFLDPFIKPKGLQSNDPEHEIVFEECYDEDVLNEAEMGTDYPTSWEGVDVKPNIREKPVSKDDTSESETDTSTSKSKRKKRGKGDDRDKDDSREVEDLQFFKSILPDIKNFTPKEKRKLKMGILKIIDEIDNERKSISHS